MNYDLVKKYIYNLIYQKMNLSKLLYMKSHIKLK